MSLNVLNFGADPDGNVDSTNAIKNAIAALPSTGGTINFPAGKYLVDRIRVKDKLVHIRGAGGPGQEIATGFISPTIIRSVSNRSIIKYTMKDRNNPRSRFCSISDLAVVGSLTAGSRQHGIQIDNRGLNLTNVGVWNAGGHGVFLTDSVSSTLIAVHVTECGGDGFRVDDYGAFATTMIGCAAVANKGDGYHAEHSANGTVSSGLVVEGNAGYGIYLDGEGPDRFSKFSRFYGTWDEINQTGSVYFGEGALQNLVDYVRWASPPPVYSVWQNQNVVWGSTLFDSLGNDLDFAVGMKVRAFNLDSQIRFRSRDDTGGADVLAASFVGNHIIAEERFVLFPDSQDGALIVWGENRLSPPTGAPIATPSVANIEAQGNRTLQLNAPEIMLATGQTERLRVDTTGNVGIGISAPEEKLDVAGRIKASELVTGDIVFQRKGKKLWRLFEDDEGVYVENIKTGRIFRVSLEAIPS